MENTRKIYEVLTKGKAKIDKNFARLIELGYDSDSCQELSNEIVGYLKNIAIAGLNSGKSFSKAEKVCIKKLGDVAVKLSKKNASKNLHKYGEEVDEIISGLTSVVSAPVYENNSMIATIDTYLTTTISGVISVRDSIENNDKQVAILNDCVTKLEKIKEKFNSEVWDNISEKACAYEKAIVEKINALRDDIQAKMIISTTSTSLDEVEKLVSEWAKLTGIERKNKPAKATDIAIFREDNLTRTTASAIVYEKAQTLFGNVDIYNSVTEKITDVSEIQAKIDAENVEIERFNAELDEIAIKIANDGVDLSHEIVRINGRIKRHNDRINRYKRQIEDKEIRATQREEVADYLDRIKEVYDFAEYSPVLIYEIFKTTDFTKVSRILDPSADPDTIYATIKELYQIFVRDDIINQNGELQRDNLRSLATELDKMRDNRTTVTTLDDVAKETEKNQAELDKAKAWALERLQKKGITQTNTTVASENKTEETTQTEVKARTVLSSEDN